MGNSKFITEGSTLRHEGDDAGDWVRDLAEIIKAHGGTDDPQVIFTARAKQLALRNLEKAKALMPRDPGGRPQGRTRMLEIQRELLLSHGRTQAARANWFRVRRNTYRRAESEGRATEKTAQRIAGRLGIDLKDLLRK